MCIYIYIYEKKCNGREIPSYKYKHKAFPTIHPNIVTGKPADRISDG